MRLLVSLFVGVQLATFGGGVSAVVPTVAAPVTEVTPAFGMSGVLQAAVGLAVILALIFLCGWAARRLGLQQHSSGKIVKVISSAMVGQRERVVVVEIGCTWLVLGVGSGQVRTLHTLPAQNQPENLTSATRNTPSINSFSHQFMASLGKLKKRA